MSAIALLEFLLKMNLSRIILKMITIFLSQLKKMSLNLESQKRGFFSFEKKLVIFTIDFEAWFQIENLSRLRDQDFLFNNSL